MYIYGMGNNENQQDDQPRWMNFICPSCAVAYGVNALIKTLKRRRKQTAASVDEIRS